MYFVLRMNSMRTNLILTLAGCALAAATAGCMRPWSGVTARSDGGSLPVANSIPPTAMVPPAAQIGSDPAAADMAGVMEKLAQVREMDPAAEQKLIDELRRTPPNSWSLVAEQFRASLAYHQQLVSKPLKVGERGDPMAEVRRAPPVTAAESPMQKSIEGAPAGLAAVASRPSDAIGTLLDPHDASSESDPIVAQSTPYATPRPMDGELTSTPSEGRVPGEFASSGPTYPIGTQRGTGVEAAAFQSPASDTVEAATQAIAKADAAGVPREPIAPAAGEGKAASKPTGSPSTLDEGNWQPLVQQAADDLSQHVSQSPTTTAEVHQHVSLRLLRLLAGDTERALEPIPHIPPAEQDYWSRQIFALATYLDHHSQPDDKRRAAASVIHLDEAVSHLRELGALSLRSLSFCKNVYGYGAIEPFETDTFTPGQHVWLYVEVENYHSKSSEKGFCTSLGATYELLDDKNKRVSVGDFPDVEDCCRSRRRDFHIQFGLALPDNLAPGRYRVEVVVKDRQSDKLGHATVPFEIQSGRK